MKLRKGLLGILFSFTKQKSLSEALTLVRQSFNVNKGYKADIKSTLICVKEIFCILGNWPVGYSLIVGDSYVLSINSISIYLLSWFYQWNTFTQLLMSSITIDSVYIRTIISRSTYCFASRKESWYPPEHNFCNFRELKLFLPNWSESIKISADDLERLWTWTNNCARAVRQRHFHQEIKMTKTGRFFHVIFILTNKQGNQYHSGVNQSKTIMKPTMLIQLKMTQNEEKHVKNE